MTDKTFWFLTVMREEGWEKRCWGFFDDFIQAEQAVINNDSDIYECEYEYAVLEEHHMGTIAMGTGRMFWYRYNQDTEQYEKIDPPKWSQNVVHWGIG
jgi:hypothetical protein